MRKVRVKFRYAHPQVLSDDIPVKGDLAVTPAQMARMAANGVGISSQLSSSFNDGDTNVTWDLPLGQMRGLDIVDFWESQKTSRLRVKDHIKANEKKFGDSTIKTN